MRARRATAVRRRLCTPVMGCAQTGSGKTAAFALPMLHLLSQDPYGVFAVVLTPTRWLARCLLLRPRPPSHPALVGLPIFPPTVSVIADARDAP